MQFHKTVLPNGMRVIYVPIRDNQTVTVMVLVEAGSDYEEKNINGISHFLEHMCFKGTTRRPSAKIISSELDGIGAESNAFTGNEYTGYYAKAHKKHLSKLLDIVSDIYLHSTLPEKEMEKEKGVVIEEISMYEDMPQVKVEDVLDTLLYANQPAGQTILGPKENIRKFKRQTLLQYRKSHYVAKATVLVVAGNFDQKKLQKMVKETFAPISTLTKKPKLKTLNRQKIPGIKLFSKKTDQVHLRIAFRSFDMYDSRFWPAVLLAGILGGGMSSRLFQKMREELGICYYISAHNRTFLDRGQFVIPVGVTKSRTEEAISAILEEIKTISSELVSEEELQRAKEYRIGHLFLGLESSDDFADFYGFQELYHDRILLPELYAEKLKKVTAEDVQKVARDIFKSSNLNLAIVGPFKEEKQFRPLLKI